MGYLELLKESEQTTGDNQAPTSLSLPPAKPGYEVVAVWQYRRITIANGEEWIVKKRLDKPGWKSWPVKKG